MPKLKLKPAGITEERKEVIPAPPKKEPERKQLIRLSNGKYLIPEGVVYHKGVYYDYTTTNTTYLTLVKDLKDEGIKYNYFSLALYDIELYGVDPYDPNLTSDQINKIIVECYRNPWYFMREVSRIPVAGGKSVPCRINRACCAVIWLFLLGIDSYITIARQIGKTTTIVAILVWAYIFGTTNSQFMFMHIDKARASKNLKDLKDQMEALPKYMQQESKIDFETGKISKSKNNVNSIRNVYNNNEIITNGQANSAEAASNLGRGLSQPIQFFDEFEFIKYNDEVLAVSGPSFVTVSEAAEKNGAMFGRFFSSTAGDLDSQAGKAAQKLLNETMRWDENLYDEYRKHGKQHVRDIVKKSSKVKVVYIEYPYYLLGKGDRYYYDMAATINNKIRFRREILLQRIHGSSNSPFDAEDIATIYENRQKPIMTQYIMGLYKFDIYKKLDPQRVYFMGVDPSDGVGLDNFTIVITDPYEDDEVVATLASPYMNPIDQPKVIALIARQYVRRGPIAIERNKGMAILAALAASPLRPRIYCSVPEEIKANPEVTDRQGHLIRESKFRRELGIWTGKNSREQMMGLLTWYVKEYKRSFVDPALISELMTLVIKNNKIQADVGAHDDYVMAYLMALYVKHFGKRLDQYGYIKGKPIQLQRDDYDYSKMTLQERDAMYNQLPEEIQAMFPKYKTNEDYKNQMRSEYIKARAKIQQDYGEDPYYNGSIEDMGLDNNTNINPDNLLRGGNYSLPQSFWDEIYSNDN